jgi:hypothetical protein
MTFVIIVLVCNQLGCYWAPMGDKRSFEDQRECMKALPGPSAMYFDAACMVNAHGQSPSPSPKVQP